MTAVLYDDAVSTLPAPTTSGPAVGHQTKRLRRPHGNAVGDPLVDAAARLLSIPLRQVYAALWRVGLIEVTA